ncbi:MAG: LutC/YkgG family protein [Methylocystaceae bacterium]
MTSREQILGRIQSASWANGKLPAPVIAASARQTGEVDLFTSRVQAAGANVERVNDIAAARALLATIIQEQQLERIIGADDQATGEMRLPELAVEIGFAYQSSSELKGNQYRDYVINAQLGISGCSYGIAETGTLVLAHNHANERLVSHAPDHYVGLIYPEQILADRLVLGSILQAETDPPAAWTLVTGVSRTADVALQVVLGMHGPRRVTVIIIG